MDMTEGTTTVDEGSTFTSALYTSRRGFLTLAGKLTAGLLTVLSGMVRFVPMAWAEPSLRPNHGGEGEPVGTWYLNAHHSRVTVSIARGSRSRAHVGALVNEKGGQERLDHIGFDASAGTLTFRRTGQGFWEWYRGTVVEGVFVGRFSRSARSPDRPRELASYGFQVTGWNSTYLDQDVVPRVYEVTIDKNFHGRLRIDRSLTGQYIGRLKVYAGPGGEELEYDLQVTKWDGRTLAFIRRDPKWTQTYTGTINGGTISGTFTHSGQRGTFPWSGRRAEVLSYGLAPKSSAARNAWQQRTRRQLYHLMMAGNPAPLRRDIVVGRVMQPLKGRFKDDRDDDPLRHGQDYRLVELHFRYSVPNPHATGSIRRQAHAYLAIPHRTSPRGGFPAVLALNGHGGSAWQVMNPGTQYWYGDAFARRGWVVLAMDIGHRNDSPLYHDDYSRGGDDSDHGNGPHPSIRAPKIRNSDWEEDGERAWDVMRGLDFLLGDRGNVTYKGPVSLPPVSKGSIVVTGLSMGGEIATIVGALDPRVAMSIPAGFSPDMGVMLHHHNHPCWRWAKADIREYIDVSDYHALTSPRPLLVETGKKDPTFSNFKPPFAADKQAVRRSRASYNDRPSRFGHYLHCSKHHYHVGDVDPKPKPPGGYERGVHVPDIIEPAPQAPWSLSWQVDPRTRIDPTIGKPSPTIFDYIKYLLG